jgi:hypothetical protein
MSKRPNCWAASEQSLPADPQSEPEIPSEKTDVILRRRLEVSSGITQNTCHLDGNDQLNHFPHQSQTYQH